MFDSDGHVTGVEHEAQTESHTLIEELMILANEQVAGYLADRKLPALYRVHEKPDPQSVETMVAQLASLDIPTPALPRNMSPQQAADIAAEASRLAAAEARRSDRGRDSFGSLVLRSLKQAYYTPRNLGHAGLASARYCHFTSPIRRYPDLVVHRALLSGLGIDSTAPRARELDEAGIEASAREREAMKIERDADDVCSGVPARAPAVRAAGRRPAGLRGRDRGRDSQGRVHPLRRRGLRGLPARPPPARLVRPQRGGHGADRQRLRPRAAHRRPDPGDRRPRRCASRARGPAADARRLEGMAKKKGGKRKIGAGDVASNRQASYRYHLLDKWECGIVLQGSEVKSIREGGVQIKDAYAALRDGEVWLHNMHIAPYGPAARDGHEPERERKLLLNRREIDRLAAQSAERGLTIVPTRIYFKGSRAKVEIALAKGKDAFDKRRDIKAKDQRREIDRALAEHGR